MFSINFPFSCLNLIAVFSVYYKTCLFIQLHGKDEINSQEGKGGEEGAPTEEGQRGSGSKGKEASLSSAPPIPSQKALTHEGGGEDGGRG